MNQIISSINQTFILKSGTIGDKDMPNSICYLLTCGRVIQDQLTQLTTYQDVFQEITIPKNSDSFIQSFWIVGKFYSSEGGTLQGQIRFVLPDKTESTPIALTGTVKPGTIFITSFFPLVKFTQVGTYYLRLKVGDEELETHNLFYFEVKKQI